MKKRSLFTGLLFAVFSMLHLQAQDLPDGFASVAGRGLATTTGGAGGKTVVVGSLDTLQAYAGKTGPYIIIVRGVIASEEFAEVDIESNKTIVGLGTDATLKNIELHIIDKENIIIRNLTIRDSYVEGDWDGKTNDNDAIQADNTHHLWIDHCHLSRCGDGLMDIRKTGWDYITVSWVHLSRHNKAFGIGWTDDTVSKMTIHHCFFDSTRVRNPSCGNGKIHLYNNFTDRNEGGYGNLARGMARLVIENSFFRDATDPINSIEDGVIYAAGNDFENCLRNTTGNVDTMPFNPASYYDYELDSVHKVEEIVKAGANPQSTISDQYTSGLQTVDLTVQVNEGNGSVTPGSGSFFKGETIQVMATPDSGYLFDHWSGDASGTSPSLTITLDENTSVNAHFIEDTTPITSIAEVINDANALSYYINNKTKTLHVKSESQKLALSIYTTDGKLMISKEYIQPGKLAIPLNRFTPGVYFVRFEFNNIVKTDQIILF